MNSQLTAPMCCRRRGRGLFVAILLGLNAFLATNSNAYLADIQTLSTNRYFYLFSGLTNLAPVGTKIWFVADMNHDGVATNVTANGLVGGDNFLLFESFVDGSLFGNNPGRYRFNGLSVDDALATANIYVYLWNTNSSAENGGDKFGILNLGVLPPPQLGNATWTISNNIFADVFTLRAYNTNIWVANTSGNWSDGATVWTNAPTIGGSSTNYLLFGGQTAYVATNDLGTFLLNNLEHTGSGNVTLTGGALRFTNEFGFPLINQTGAGTFLISNDIQVTSTLTLTGDSNGLVTLGGVISGPLGDLLKTGKSTYLLSGQNSFSGDFEIDDGTILFGSPTALGTGDVIFNGGANVATLASPDATARTISNRIVLNAGMALGQSVGGTGTLTLAGGVDLFGGARTITVNNLSNIISGVVSNGSLIKDGSGLLLLSGNNTFTGSVTISNGVLAAGSTGAFNAIDPNLVFLQGGTFRLNGFPITVGGLSGNLGTVENSQATPAALTLAIPTNASSTFAGLLADGAAGTLRIIKTGAGAFVAGGDNTYTGGTDIKAGSISTDFANGLGTGPITLGGGLLALHADTNRTFGPSGGYSITLTNNSILNIDKTSDEVVATNKTLSIGVLNVGSNALTVTSGSAYVLGVTGAISLSNSTINSQGAKVNFLSNVTFLATNSLTGFDAIAFSRTNTFAVNAGVSASVASGVIFSNTIVLNGANTIESIGDVNVVGRIVDGTAVSSLIKDGAGRMYITNAVTNTFSGGTLIKNGALRISSVASNALGIGPVTMSGGLLELRSDTSGDFGATNGYSVAVTGNAGIDVNQVATGTGRVLSLGAVSVASNGNLSVTGSNGYSLALNRVSALSNGTVAALSAPMNFRSNVVLHGNNTFGGTNTITVTGSIQDGSSIPASLNKTGSGLLSLLNSNSFSGDMVIGNGTVQLGSANALGSVNSLVVNGGTLLLAGGAITNRIRDGAAVRMAGGKINTAGLSETLGVLTLAANSIIDLGSGNSIIRFANSAAAAWSGGTTLSIYNWTGTLGNGGGTDQLFFGTGVTGLTSAQAAQILFYSDAGTTFLNMGVILSTGEVVPVPEPATWIAAISVLALLIWRERSRLVRLVRHMRQPAPRG